jgi:hypothetical protein
MGGSGTSHQFFHLTVGWNKTNTGADFVQALYKDVLTSEADLLI